MGGKKINKITISIASGYGVEFTSEYPVTTDIKLYENGNQHDAVISTDTFNVVIPTNNTDLSVWSISPTSDDTYIYKLIQG